MRTKWDERYGDAEYAFGTEPNDFLRDETGRIPSGGDVLCLADGEGRNGVYLAEQGYTVCSVDLSEVGLEKARKLASANGVSIDFEMADLKTWNWDGASYDFVVAIFIQFADPAFRAEIFDGMKRAVKPGGLILLHGYTPKQIEYGTGGPGVVENLYTEELLCSAFADFEIEELSSYDKVIDEGPGHSGISALIDLVARKPA